MVYLSIYFCVVFSFLHQHLILLKYSSFSSDRFIPRYFTVFDARVNVIISIIYLSNSLLLVYRKATDFCILILYPANLPNSLMSCNCFLVESLRFSCIESCHLQTVTVLILPFQFVSLLHLFLL